MYDIFYVSQIDKNKNQNWQKFKSRYSTAKYALSVAEAQKKSLTKFFWAVWDDLVVDQSFSFDYEPDQWSNEYIHVFKNGNYYDGICLIPKKAAISQKEIEHRFFVNKKEIDIVASKPKPYDVFEIDSYEEYLTALENSTSRMFWAIWNDVVVSDNFKFNYQIPFYNQSIVHVFKNGNFYDGICLFSKNNTITEKELKHRFFVNKKEVDIVASKPKSYDVVFISYQESNADENYKKILKKYPKAKRINGVKGIHQAHIAAAKSCKTDMFWIVDGDAVLLDDFDFDYQVSRWDQETVHVWRSQNPINDLVYGYGGVKLFPRQLTINMDTTKPDMTTSISSKFKVVEEISNITAFNTDPFNTWKSAFRECAKLSSGIIDRQNDYETNHRLMTWTSVGENRPFGEYAIHGANAGRNFGLFSGNKINLINDFDWLKEQFNQSFKED